MKFGTKRTETRKYKKRSGVINTGRVISTALQFIDGFTKPSKEVIKNMQKMANNMSRNAKEIQKAGKVI